MTIEEANGFYYRGRNAVWNGTGKVKFADPDAQKHFDRGYQSAAAEERLDRDTEWDGD